ncbi:fimbrial protein [Entomohabitans teleogrylli]|uniref:fimbrial protein n=1 Tax=Entomohabitans teleogrylli TaxID=1384589 RepID=UPI00073D69F1|nr:fimbrial protein [Entomohabitans teleogrylli]
MTNNIALLVSALLIVPLSASAGTDVEFSGTLVGEPCVVSMDSEEQTVSFDGLSVQQFASATRSEARTFAIKLEDCDLSVGDQVSVRFIGTEDPSQPGAFQVNGDATGVAIAVEDASGQAVKPGILTAKQPLQSNETILNYKAWAQVIDRSALQEGSFTTTVSWVLEYE